MVPAEAIKQHIGVNVLPDLVVDTAMLTSTNACQARAFMGCVKKD